MKNYLLIILLLAFTAAHSQNVRQITGSVTDSTGTTLPGINIKLVNDTDSSRAITDTDGKFILKTAGNSFKLTVSGIGYKTFTKQYSFVKAGPLTLSPVVLQYEINILDLVNINATRNPITIKEDTVEYDAGAYKVREGSQVEDLLKKMPGMDVDKDGNVVAHGKPITKVRVNGKDYFKGDVQTATQNLPADIIDNIQVIDDYGDQANLTGIKSGEPEKILNINIQKGKNKGAFGRATTGAGNQGRYLVGLSANLFNDDRQISVLGNLNNTNTNAFNFGGGGNFSRGLGGSSRGVSSGGGSNGITTNRSIGVNFRDQWGKKLSVYGSYSFANRDYEAISTSLSKEVYQKKNINRNNQTNNGSLSNNHRFDFNMEYKIDSLNYIKISPDFSYGSSNNTNNNTFTNIIDSITANGIQSDTISGYHITDNNASSPSGGINVLYNHKFHKRGRNFSINANYSFSNNNNGLNDDYITVLDNAETPLLQQINTTTATQRVNTRLSYIEPVGKSTFVEMEYAFNRNNNENTRLNYRVDALTNEFVYVDSLSTDYNFQFINHSVGLNLRGVYTRHNYTIGLDVRPTTLRGQFRGNFTRTNTFNWVPTARYVYRLERNRSFNFNYRGSNNQPSFSQLQPQPDFSNPQSRVYGNPNLKPEFTNNVNFSYNQFDMQSGNSLFANLGISQTSDKIVTNSTAFIDSAGRIIREIKYINTNGFYNMHGNYTFTKPFMQRKLSVGLNGNVNYSNNVTFLENNRNTGQNWVITQGAKIRADIDSLMDTEINARYTINSTRYSLPNSINNNARTFVIGIDGRNYFNDLVLGYSLSKTFNSGFSRTVRANPTLFNAYIEYQFLKKRAASLRLQAFDIFDQNTGVSIVTTDNQVVESRTNRLGRYFLLTFTINLRKFTGSGGGSRNGGFRRGGGRM